MQRIGNKMKNKSSFQTYLAIITFALLLMLIIIQVSWLFKIAEFEEKQFNDKVENTLKCVKKELWARAENNANMKDYLTGKRCASLVRKEKIKEIDSIVNYHIENNNIELDYNFSIGDSAYAAEEKKFYRSKCYLDKLNGLIEKDGIHLCIKFPTRNQFLFAQMKGWFIVSIFFIIFIAISFFIVMRLFLKEKAMLVRTTDFINNMVHEFQTPIANIKFASNLIRKRNSEIDDSKTNEYSKVINGEAEKLETNIERILNIACPSNSAEFEDVDIHNVINEVVLQYSYRTEELGAKINQELNAKNCILKGEPEQFRLLISNLIDNALKYASNNPVVTITSDDVHDRFITIKVVDNGIGIDKSEQGNIFDKYYRVSTGNIHNVKGFGLGLTYVKKIVELYNGSILVKSKIGHGSEFIIKLPIVYEGE